MHTLLLPAAPVSAPSQSTQVNCADLAVTLLGPSAAMSQLWTQIRRLAPHVRTVLLTGAPDTGQEAVARLLLDLSLWPQRPFLVLREAEAEERLTRANALNALPHDVFVFVPELDRLSAAAQEGLLRLLRMRRSRGFSVVAATAEDLRSLVAAGKFSSELAEAVGPVRIVLPALRERKEDLPMLLTQTLALRCQDAERRVPQLSQELLHAAMQHAWPGNLHDLAAVVDDLLAVTHHSGFRGELGLNDFEHALANVQAPKPASAQVRLIKLDTVVQEHIFSVLRACHGNKLRAAEVLGISRSTLYRMLEAAAQTDALPLAS